MAYTAAVTLDTPKSERISRTLGIITGKCDITKDHATPAEITDITGHFLALHAVIVDALSDNGHIVRWNRTDKCFHGRAPVGAHVHTINLSATHAGGAIELVAEADDSALGGVGGARTGITGIQNNAIHVADAVADDTDIGEVNFVAIGVHR